MSGPSTDRMALAVAASGPCAATVRAEERRVLVTASAPGDCVVRVTARRDRFFGADDVVLASQTITFLAVDTRAVVDDETDPGKCDGTKRRLNLDGAYVCFSSSSSNPSLSFHADGDLVGFVPDELLLGRLDARHVLSCGVDRCYVRSVAGEAVAEMPGLGSLHEMAPDAASVFNPQGHWAILPGEPVRVRRVRVASAASFVVETYRWQDGQLVAEAPRTVTPTPAMTLEYPPPAYGLPDQILKAWGEWAAVNDRRTGALSIVALDSGARLMDLGGQFSFAVRAGGRCS